MRKEFRKLITVKLLQLVFKVCPQGEFKKELAKFNIQHIYKL